VAPPRGVSNLVTKDTGMTEMIDTLGAAFASGFNWRGLCSDLWAESGERGNLS